MTHPNPFAPQQPAEPAPATPAAANPFAQPAAAPAPGAYLQPPAPQFGAAAGGAVAPSWLAQPAAAAPATSYGTGPAAQMVPHQAAPPAINLDGLRSVGAPPPSGGKGPAMAHMYNRLVMMFPLSRSQRPKRSEHITDEDRQAGRTTQDTITTTVVVLDGGPGRMDPITFGGKPTAFPPVPDTESAPLPYVRKAMWIQQGKVIAQIESALPTGPGEQPGVFLGRVFKAGPAHNDPWYLLEATPQDLELARQYLVLVASGQYPHPLAP